MNENLLVSSTAYDTYQQLTKGGRGARGGKKGKLKRKTTAGGKPGEEPVVGILR